MAYYNDPQTGERRDVEGPLVREKRGFSVLGGIVLLAILIGFGTLAYHHMDFAADNSAANNTIENPVTSPSDPNASPVHPAPSPNPGP